MVAPTDGADRAPALLDLPPELCTLIASMLKPPTARALASTASAALQLVLEARIDLRAFTVPADLAHCMARLQFCPAASACCCAIARFDVAGFTCRVHTTLHAMARICAEQQHTASRLPAPLFAFSPTAIVSAIKIVLAEPLHTFCGALFALPGGMRSLQEVDVTGCRSLASDWLPLSSRESVRTLIAVNASISGVPGDLFNLQDLDVSQCALVSDWLPASSCAAVRTLTANHPTLKSVPEDMGTLEAVCVRGCSALVAEWLPASSRERLRDVRASHSNLVGIAGGTSRLEEVHVDSCKQLFPAGWLPADSACCVRTLCAEGSNLMALPAGMRALETLDVSGCHLLAPGCNWVPASSGGQLRVLQAKGASLTSVPRDLGALQEVHIASCAFLGADWLPSSSRAHVHVLDVSGSCITAVPGQRALKRLDVSDCARLQPDWLPHGSRWKLRVLLARSTSSLHERTVALPDGCCALEVEDVTGCNRLDGRRGANWIPGRSRRCVHTLLAGGSNICSIPEDMDSLRELTVTGSRELSRDCWLPASSAARITHLHATSSVLQALPPYMHTLTVLSVTHCVLLADGPCWLPASSAQHVHTLHAGSSSLTALPAGMAALETVAVEECKLAYAWLPESSAQHVRTLTARASTLQQLPHGMGNLEEVEVRECSDLARDWLPLDSACTR